MMSSRRRLADQVNGETAGEPVDVLARRPSKARRNRDWERRQRETVGFAGYRGIPPELNDEIKDVAEELGVRVGEVARAFLEYALEAYYRGELQLEPQPRPGKFTLYPAG